MARLLHHPEVQRGQLNREVGIVEHEFTDRRSGVQAVQVGH